MESELLIDLKLVRVLKGCERLFKAGYPPSLSDVLTVSHVSLEYTKVDKDKYQDDDVIIWQYDYQFDYESKVGEAYIEEKRIFFEDQEITNNVRKKLGVDENYKPFKTNDYTWIALKNGFIAFREDRLYFIRMKVERETKNELIEVKAQFKDCKKIGFIIGKLDLRIMNVHECQDSSKILIDCGNEYDKHLIVVWNLEDDREVKNFSTNQYFN